MNPALDFMGRCVVTAGQRSSTFHYIAPHLIVYKRLILRETGGSYSSTPTIDKAANYCVAVACGLFLLMIIIQQWLFQKKAAESKAETSGYVPSYMVY